MKYSVPITEKRRGESEIYRHPNVATVELKTNIYPELKTMQDYVLIRTKKFGDLKWFGTRSPTIGNPYVWKTSKEVFEIVQNLGSSIINENLAPLLQEYQNIPVQFIGIYSKNREEWAYCDLASMLFGFTSVPFYDTLGIKAIIFILDQTNLTSIFCSKECLDTLLKEDYLAKVRNLICFDKIEPEKQELIRKKGYTYYYFGELLEKGQINRKIYPSQINPQQMYSLIYTSGTTGNPKGAMITHENMACTLVAITTSDLYFNTNDRYLSYLPLAHVYERTVFHYASLLGSCIGFYSGNVLKIKEDMAELKPTVFASAPRLFNKFYDGLKKTFGELGCCKKWMVEKALASKLANLNSNRVVTHKCWDALVFNKVKEAFGGQIRLFVTASAPMPLEVMNFLKVVFGCGFIDGYGQTEGIGLLTVTNVNDFVGGYIGGPTFANEMKLVDIPEMNYTSLDKDQNGNPAPRGELCFRGKNITPGYYKEYEKTLEAIDNEGWLHTGDVCLLLPNGALKIIDRKKHIFKLSQGEYIAPEKLEIIYTRCKAVEEIFVYGDSFQNYLIAIVFPKKSFIMELAQKLNIPINAIFEDVIKQENIKKEVLKELDAHWKAEALLKLEKILKLVLVPEGFGNAGLYTTTFKLKRHEAGMHFRKFLDEMYKEPLIILE